jgi:hypothetical protein
MEWARDDETRKKNDSTKMTNLAGTMDPEQAKALTLSGAYIVCHGVPQGTEIGVDYMSFQVYKASLHAHRK